MNKPKFKFTTISNIIDKTNKSIKLDESLLNCYLKAKVTRISKYEWASYLELDDETGSITAILPKKIIIQPIKENDIILIEGSIQISNKSRFQISIKNYSISIDKPKTDKINDIRIYLENNGYFNNPKREISNSIYNLAIISSFNAAALKDCLKTLQHNMICGNIFIYPCNVQGDNTAPSIIKQINLANNNKFIEAILITRGGGSKSDLDWFNNLELAIAVRTSAIPIACGIGHEIDRTIIDDVADKSFITPTSASNGLTSGHSNKKIIIENLLNKYNHISHKFFNKFQYYSNLLNSNYKDIEYYRSTRINFLINHHHNLINNLLSVYSNYISRLNINQPINILNSYLNTFMNLENKFYINYDNHLNDLKDELSFYQNKIDIFSRPKIFIENYEISSKKEFIKYLKSRGRDINLMFIDGSINLEKVIEYF